MKRIIFVTNIDDWVKFNYMDDDCKEYVTYEETNIAIQNGDDDIVTTSFLHFSLELIEKGYDIYLFNEGKLKKIHPNKKLKDGSLLNIEDNIIQLYQHNLL